MSTVFKEVVSAHKDAYPPLGKMLHPHLKIMSVELIGSNTLRGHLSSVELALICYCSVEGTTKLHR